MTKNKVSASCNLINEVIGAMQDMVNEAERYVFAMQTFYKFTGSQKSGITRHIKAMASEAWLNARLGRSDLLKFTDFMEYCCVGHKI